MRPMLRRDFLKYLSGLSFIGSLSILADSETDIDNLFQLHWQFKDGTTEIWAQSKIKTIKEMKTWLKEVAERHPLPEGAQWLVCNTKSKHFVWAAK